MCASIRSAVDGTLGLKRLTAALLVAVSIFLAHFSSAIAQSPAPADATPSQVQRLLDLLGDPVVRDWLDKRRAVRWRRPAARSGTEAAQQGAAGSFMAERTVAIRQHIGGLVRQALPTVPDELERVRARLMVELQNHGFWQVLLLVVGFVALGVGVELLFLRATRGIMQWIVGLRLELVGERLAAMGIRLGYGLGFVTAFALGSIGAFLLFAWPPLLREIVFTYLVAFLVLRLALVLGRFLLSTGAARFRIIPMDDAAARFWHIRIGVIVGWFAICWVTLSLMDALGMQIDARRLIAIACVLVLLAIVVETAWRRPIRARAADGDLAPRRRSVRSVGTWLLTLYFVLLTVLWVATARPLFWLLVVAFFVPVAVGILRRSVNHVMRPPGSADATSQLPSIAAVALERGLVTLLIVGAAVVSRGQVGHRPCRDDRLRHADHPPAARCAQRGGHRAGRRLRCGTSSRRSSTGSSPAPTTRMPATKRRQARAADASADLPQSRLHRARWSWSR